MIHPASFNDKALSRVQPCREGFVTKFTQDQVNAVFTRMAETVAENERYLNELDTTIGDAEHGLNLLRGFEALSSKLLSLEGLEPAAIIRRAGMALAGAGCGSGPIFYGVAIRAAGDSLMKTGCRTPQDVAAALEAALCIIKEKGGAQVGQKTMVDAIEPATIAFRSSVDSGKDLAAALEDAVLAAKEGAESTRDMLGMKGRGYHAGERGLGHQDPGATSAYLLIKAIYDVVRADQGQQ